MEVESDDIENAPARPVRLDLAPILAAGSGDRRLNDAAILRPIRIGEDDESAILMMDGVIVLRLPPGHKARRSRRVGGVDQAHLGGLLIMHAEQEEAPVLRRAEAKEVTRVILLMNDVVASVGAYRMSKHAARAVLFVKPDVE